MPLACAAVYAWTLDLCRLGALRSLSPPDNASKGPASSPPSSPPLIPSPAPRAAAAADASSVDSDVRAAADWAAAASGDRGPECVRVRELLRRPAVTAAGDDGLGQLSAGLTRT